MANAKISLNKLGEYLTATPSRRRRIVEDQKAPKTFIAARYGDAREEIVGYLSEGMADDEGMLAAAHRLRNVNEGSDFFKQDKLASADAIENFLDVSEKIDLDGTAVIPVDKKESSQFEVAGVAISVRPEVILTNPKTGRPIGAVKLHFPKTNPLSELAAEYVATGLRVYLEQHYPDAKINPKKCSVVDVSTGVVVSAPRAIKRKMDDVVAACEEISARWQR